MVVGDSGLSGHVLGSDERTPPQGPADVGDHGESDLLRCADMTRWRFIIRMPFSVAFSDVELATATVTFCVRAPPHARTRGSRTPACPAREARFSANKGMLCVQWQLLMSKTLGSLRLEP